MKHFVLQTTGEGLLLVLIVSAPPILISMAVGLMISIFQATTQIQEQTLTFVPKVVAVFGSLLMVGAWILSQLIRYTENILKTFPTMIN